MPPRKRNQMSEGYFEEEKDIYTDVQLLKKDLNSLYRIVDKLDVTIDKLTDITASLDKMLTVQQKHIEQQERDDKFIMNKVSELSDRVKKLENSKWFLVGIAAAVGFVVAQLPIVNSLLN